MLFAFVCTDKPQHLELRLATRPAHIEFLKGLNAKGVVKAAGPFLNDNGKPCGTLAIFEVKSRAEAEALAKLDPYATAALFESVDIRAFDWVMNPPQ